MKMGEKETEENHFFSYNKYNAFCYLILQKLKWGKKQMFGIASKSNISGPKWKKI